MGKALLIADLGGVAVPIPSKGDLVLLLPSMSVFAVHDGVKGWFVLLFDKHFFNNKQTLRVHTRACVASAHNERVRLCYHSSLPTHFEKHH